MMECPPSGRAAEEPVRSFFPPMEKILCSALSAEGVWRGSWARLEWCWRDSRAPEGARSVAGPGQGLHPLESARGAEGLPESLCLQFGVQTSACGARHVSLK